MIQEVGYQSTPVWTPAGDGRPVLLWNLHLTAPVYFGESTSVSVDSDSIPPLGSVEIDGVYTIYASSANSSVTIPLQVTPGASSVQPSPAQVANQLSLLGLAKDSTVQGLPNQLQTMGIPPFVPNIISKVVKNQGPTAPTTFFTFTAAGRLWGGSLSFAMATNNAAGGGTIQGYAAVVTGSGTTVGLAECNTGGASNSDSATVPLLGGGFPVALNDTLQIDVNNGVNMGVNGLMRASVVAWISVP